MSEPIVPLAALGAFVLVGLLIAWLLAGRRFQADSGRPGDPTAVGASNTPSGSSVEDASTGFEDPLVAAMDRGPGGPHGSPSWKVVAPSQAADGPDEPRWVRRLDARMPILPTTSHPDRDLPAQDSGVDADLG